MFKYCLLISLTLLFFSKTLLAQHYQFQKAAYKIVEDSILVEKGKTIWQIEPPVYEMTIEKRMYAPQHQKWVKKTLKDSEHQCCQCPRWELKYIPAKYKYYKTKTLKTPAHFKAVKEPDIYQKTTKIIKLSPAKLRKI